MSLLPSPTFGNLVDEVLAALHGHTGDLEEVTYLTSACLSTDTTLSVNDASQITRGLIEIESELLWVISTDSTANSITVAPFGRGFRQTTATAHAQNTMVMNNPRYPRQYIKDAIQDTIFAVYPDLFQVKTDESNLVIPVQISYPVPSDCELVLDVRWANIGPSKLWVPARRFKLDTKADTTTFITGKSLEIYDGMVPGRTIKVTYIAQPGQLLNEGDFLDSTGLRDSTQDVLKYGACFRLLVNLESSRLQTFSVEQSERSMLVPPGSAMQASRYYLSLYEQALQREALRLQKLLPSRTHLVR